MELGTIWWDIRRALYPFTITSGTYDWFAISGPLIWNPNDIGLLTGIPKSMGMEGQPDICE